jgi:fluoride exporter
MIHLLYIGFGGFIGAILRYIISKYFNNFVASFPLGTFVVNVLGSLLLGFIIYSISFGKNIPTNTRDFITIGFIGAFTTMSTLAYESFRLLDGKEFIYFGLNLFLNVFFCLIAVYAGKELAILITK